jgi:hypothetical protein
MPVSSAFAPLRWELNRAGDPGGRHPVATFNAGTEVEPIQYDFTFCDAGKGTVPEPSEDQLEAWTRGVAELGLAALAAAGGDDGEQMSTREWLARQVEIPPGSLRQDAEKAAQVYAAVCSNQPSADDLMKLPIRYRTAFYGWLSGQFRRAAT